jgi:predicted transcriptional regulator
MATKMTFSLDDETVRRLKTAAERLRKPQSQVVREAVAEYSERIGRLSDSERSALLRTFDRLVPALPRRPQSQVDAEIRQLRADRRTGGRKGGRRGLHR